eukprot:3312852-Pleurochrysis_carterae.AAC.2
MQPPVQNNESTSSHRHPRTPTVPTKRGEANQERSDRHVRAAMLKDKSEPESRMPSQLPMPEDENELVREADAKRWDRWRETMRGRIVG